MYENMRRLVSMAAFAVIALGALAGKPVKAFFTVTPKMSCANCEAKIKKNLRYEKGIKSIVTSLDDQIVTITYDDEKTNPQNIIKGFKKIGYTAEIADEKAAADCKKSKKSDCKGKQCPDTKKK